MCTYICKQKEGWREAKQRVNEEFKKALKMKSYQDCPHCKEQIETSDMVDKDGSSNLKGSAKHAHLTCGHEVLRKV